MTTRPDTDNYLELFLNDVPLMDVRAPVEFLKGAFPNTLNVPLMDDEERRLIGIRYKEQGQDSAIELGHELVCGDNKAQKLEKWLAFTKLNPQGYLFCFRGGLRSRTTQGWIRDAGVDYPLVRGGYKAMRRFLIDELEKQVQDLDIKVISGRTGTGKTRVLKAFNNFIDLEGLANHRGSSFGRMLDPQPSQIDFENALSITLLKAKHHKKGSLILEDESRLIGRCALPLSLKERMSACPLLVLETPLEERIEVVLQDYVKDMTAAYIERDGEEQGRDNFANYLFESIGRIERRLGSERKNKVHQMMAAAIKAQFSVSSGEDAYGLHREWIEHLLNDYYDPMYDYQLSKKLDRVVMRGNKEELLESYSK
jgi:tRNA 2-selenouridine synthase